jgi:hypothetical protein
MNMDELVAAWVRATTAEQGKDEKVSDSGTVAHLIALTRAIRRARTVGRSASRATRETPDGPAE